MTKSGIKPEDGVDLRTLRAIRVLRPLKLVSGVPSKYRIVSVWLSLRCSLSVTKTMIREHCSDWRRDSEKVRGVKKIASFVFQLLSGQLTTMH